MTTKLVSFGKWPFLGLSTDKDQRLARVSAQSLGGCFHLKLSPLGEAVIGKEWALLLISFTSLSPIELVTVSPKKMTCGSSVSPELILLRFLPL